MKWFLRVRGQRPVYGHAGPIGFAHDPTRSEKSSPRSRDDVEGMGFQ